jgi:hypothetical protein
MMMRLTMTTLPTKMTTRMKRKSGAATKTVIKTMIMTKLPQTRANRQRRKKSDQL